MGNMPVRGGYRLAQVLLSRMMGCYFEGYLAIAALGSHILRRICLAVLKELGS